MTGLLLTEQRNPASEGIDGLGTEAMLRMINSEDAKVAGAVESAIPAITTLLDAIVQTVRGGGRLFYMGAGTSGRLGVLDASECPPTFSVSPELVQGIIAGGSPALTISSEGVEDDGRAGVADLFFRGFTDADFVVGIAASGRTPYVVEAIREARQLGAGTGSLCCTPDSPLSAEARYPVEVLVGPEVVTGSTRLKAGTATKLVLNMISTGLMIRLGLVYSNLMVNVQPTNEKLRQRAHRIIAAAAGVDETQAAELLRETGEVPTAIIMARLKVSALDARAKLAANGGVIARVLEGSGQKGQ